MTHLVLIVELDVKPECRERFDTAIAINANASVTKEPGCLQFDVLKSQDDPNRVVLFEVYRDAAAFQEHMGQDHTKTFLGLAKELVTRQAAAKLTRTVHPGVKAG